MITATKFASREGVWEGPLHPVLDSLPVQTWRGEDVVATALARGKVLEWQRAAGGCHGEPLERECTLCDGTGRGQEAYGPYDCADCDNTGRVPLDHPNRTDMP